MRTSARWLPFLLVVAVHAVQAADPFKPETSSLQFVRADVASYSASFGNGAWWDQVQKTKAWNSLRELPGYGAALAGWELMAADPENPIGIWQEFSSQDENLDLLDVLYDAWSQDFFIISDLDSAEISQLFSDLSILSSVAVFEVDDGSGTSQEFIEEQQKKFAATLAAMKPIRVMVGGKLARPARAATQLNRLEQLLKSAPPEFSQFVPHRRVKSSGSDLIVFTFDGKNLPWDDIESDTPLLPEFKKRVQSIRYEAAVGVHAGYLWFAFVPDAGELQKLTEGPRLWDSPEFAPIRKLAAQGNVRNIAYESAALRQAGATAAISDAQFAQIKQELENATDNPEIVKRIDAFLARLKEIAAKEAEGVGAMATITLSTPGGWESYAYDYSRPASDAADRPLELTSRIGPGTIVAAVARNTDRPDAYETVRTIFSEIGQLAEALVTLAAEEDPQAGPLVAKVVSEARTLARRLDKANVELLNPALKGVETGFFMDGQARSKAWVAGMPEAANGLPMLEIGYLTQVNDGAKLVQALAEYAAVLEDVLRLIDELDVDDEFPTMTLPTWAPKKIGGRTLQVFDGIPAEAGIDPQFMINAALEGKLAVVSTSPALTDRLLGAKAAPPGLIGEFANKPISSATYYNNAALMKFLEEWTVYGIEQVSVLLTEFGGGEDEGNPFSAVVAGSAAQHVRVVLRALACYRTVSSVTYREENATVTRTATVWEDLK